MNNNFGNLVCKKCGTHNPSNYKFCAGCGSSELVSEAPASAEQSTVLCSHCGAVSPSNCRFCISCGKTLFSQTVQTETVKNDGQKKKSSFLVPIIILLSALLVGGVVTAVILLRNQPDVSDNGNDSSYSDDIDGNDNDEGDSYTEDLHSHELPDDVYDSSYKECYISANKFSRVKASSYANWSGTHGEPDWAFDGNENSSWQDGVSGYGIGEWLLAYNSDGFAESVSSVTVYNGYYSTKYNTADKNFYSLNSRVMRFTLEFDDGSSESFTLSDSKEPQTFTFSSRDTCYVRFVIDSVYEGDKYDDTCISEIIYK